MYITSIYTVYMSVIVTRVCIRHRLLVTKMKKVFEEVMLVDGTRTMDGTTIQKTFKAAEFLVKFIMKSRTIYDE